MLFFRIPSELSLLSVRGFLLSDTGISNGSTSLCGGPVAMGEASDGFFTSHTSMRSSESPSFSFSSVSTVNFIFHPFCPELFNNWRNLSIAVLLMESSSASTFTSSI